MSPTDDFDPTHALDGWRAPTPAPLDLELRTLGRSPGSGPDEAKRARLKARGYDMLDVEDVELTERPAPPLLDLPRPPASPGLGARAFVDALRMPEVPPASDAATAPSLDVPAGPPTPVPLARLLATWQPGCWTACVHRLTASHAEVRQTPGGPHVEHHGPQWLVALWPPVDADARPLQTAARWPDRAGVVDAGSEDAALRQCLGCLPPQARLYRVDEGADWGLVAELVLQQQAPLRPAPVQALQALRALASAEREARLRRMAEGYVYEDGLARRRA